jgi:hypothetical protein
MVALDWLMHRRVLWRLSPAINFVSTALQRKRENICLIGSLWSAPDFDAFLNRPEVSAPLSFRTLQLG